METRAITPVSPAELAMRGASFEDGQLPLIQRSFTPSIKSPALFEAFIAACRALDANPLSREIYGWEDGGKLVIHPGIGFLRRRAAASGGYAGQEGPLWCGPDGVWKDVWLDESPPAACKVGVYLRGSSRPTWGVVTFKEFFRPGRNGPGQWEKFPAHMLSIRAEYHALKKACSGVFSDITAIADSLNVSVVDEEPELTSEAPPPSFYGFNQQSSAEEPAKPNFAAFWAHARDLGFDKDEVHAIAGVPSIKDWSPMKVSALALQLEARAEELERTGMLNLMPVIPSEPDEAEFFDDDIPDTPVLVPDDWEDQLKKQISLRGGKAKWSQWFFDRHGFVPTAGAVRKLVLEHGLQAALDGFGNGHA
jgi:hypothetical protein